MSKETVWILYDVEKDSDLNSHESVKKIYSSKPSKEELKEVFKHRDLRTGYIDDLLCHGFSENHFYSYDDWSSCLKEEIVHKNE